MKKASMTLCTVAIAFALTACATPRGEIPGDARDCEASSHVRRGKDDVARLQQLRDLADVFEGCMQRHGYVLDEDALYRETLRFEQIRNAERYGVDPQLSVNIHEQELRLSPRFWHKADVGK